MSNELAPTAPQNTLQLGAEERALLLNDLSKLGEDQRASLYNKVCQSIGLNPLTQPFGYITLNNKLVLYAQKNCTDQIRFLHNVTVEIKSAKKEGDIYVVIANASMPNGRQDSSTGAVAVGNLKGDALANAMMKAETKAKRRVTLSICGLSFLDETEVETIKDAKIVENTQKTSGSLAIGPTQELPGKQATPDFNSNQDPSFDNPLDAALSSKNPLDFKITFGNTFNGKWFSQLTDDELRNYCENLETHYIEKNIAIPGSVNEMLEAAIKYLNRSRR